MTSRIVVQSIAALAITAMLPAQSYPYVLTDLGTIPGQGTPIAWGINESGDKTVGSFSWPTHGWVHDAAGMSLVGALPGYVYSTARDVNDSGQIVGSSWITAITQPGHAYRFTPGVGMTDLGTLGGTSSQAWRINGSGHVVGDSGIASGDLHAFLYTDAAGMVDLTPGAWISDGRGISPDGKVAGSMTVGIGWHAFRWSPATGLLDLGVPPGYTYSYGMAVNDAGQVTGHASFSSSSNQFLWRWTPGIGFQILGTASGSAATTNAINSSGAVVGTGNFGFGNRALLYTDATGLVDLTTLIAPSTGWVLLGATDINDAGQIVGHGMHLATGQTRAYRLDPLNPAAVVTAGPGCGFGPAPSLTVTLPRIGQPLTFLVTGAAGLGGPLVFSAVPPSPVQLGFGCVVYVDVNGLVPIATILTDASGTWSTTLTVPSVSSLVGAQFAIQGALLPTPAPFGFDLTNGLHATIGF